MVQSRAAWTWAMWASGMSVASLLFAACAVDDAAEPNASGNSRDAGRVDEPDDLDEVDLGKGGSDFEQPGGKPSGATFRLVNLYVPGDDEPGPVDVYGLAWATAADKPLITVPYAEISAPFDPKVF